MRLETSFPYTAVAAQSRFLEFIATEAQRYPAFRLSMGGQVGELIAEDGVVRGIHYQGHDGCYKPRAMLVIGAADTRVRKLSGRAIQDHTRGMRLPWLSRMAEAHHEKAPQRRILQPVEDAPAIATARDEPQLA